MKGCFSKLLLLFMFVTLSTNLSLADTGSGESRLLCTLSEVVECNVQGECLELVAEDVGLPESLVIDLKEKKILESTSVSLKEGSFSSNEAIEGLTILSGQGGLRGWSAVLSDNNTRLSASVSDVTAGFVVFGACHAD